MHLIRVEKHFFFDAVFKEALMNVLLSYDDVTSWVREQNATTSNDSSKITATTSKVKGTLSCLFDTSVKIETKDGPIYVSKNALSLLSESEKKIPKPDVDKLVLRIFAEKKLSALASRTASSIPVTKEERKALESFLHVFDLEIKKDSASHALVIHRESVKQRQKEGKADFGSSTPEFILSLVHHAEGKTPVIKTVTQETPEQAHEIIEAFAKDPQRNHVVEVVHSLLSAPFDHDPLIVRKWVRKMCRKLDDTPEEKVLLCKELLVEFERQSRALTHKSGSTLSFQMLSDAIFEELLGPKDLSGRRDYLTSVLSVAEICHSDLTAVLSPFMKEALSFYTLLQENPHRNERGGLAQELALLDQAYREKDTPSLADRIHTLQKRLHTSK